MLSLSYLSSANNSMMCSKTSSGSVSSESMIEVGLQVKASDVPVK